MGWMNSGPGENSKTLAAVTIHCPKQCSPSSASAETLPWITNGSCRRHRWVTVRGKKTGCALGTGLVHVSVAFLWGRWLFCLACTSPHASTGLRYHYTLFNVQHFLPLERASIIICYWASQLPGILWKRFTDDAIFYIPVFSGFIHSFPWRRHGIHRHQLSHRLVIVLRLCNCDIFML